MNRVSRNPAWAAGIIDIAGTFLPEFVFEGHSVPCFQLSAHRERSSVLAYLEFHIGPSDEHDKAGADTHIVRYYSPQALRRVIGFLLGNEFVQCQFSTSARHFISSCLNGAASFDSMSDHTFCVQAFHLWNKRREKSLAPEPASLHN